MFGRNRCWRGVGSEILVHKDAARPADHPIASVRAPKSSAA